jgi:pilus assembly protein Flp/PilA
VIETENWRGKKNSAVGVPAYKPDTATAGGKSFALYHTGKEVREMLFLPREEGQGLVEYALILVLVAIVVIAILLLVGPAVGNVFSTIVNAI